MLHAFNTEYDTPTPGVGVLTRRLEQLLADGDTLALLTGVPAAGVTLLALRPNVWYDANSEPGDDNPLLYYFRDIGSRR